MTIIHLGAMRSGSTFLQNKFASDPRFNLKLKSRYFSYDPYYSDNEPLDCEDNGGILIDSDENYSLGRFKSKLLDYRSNDFNVKSELNVISHDLPKMASRIKETYQTARLLLVMRQQGDWLSSVYKHDLQHFGLTGCFSSFIQSELGSAYLRAGDFNQTYNLFATHFDRTSLKLMFFEDLKENEEKFLHDVYEFIGVDYFNAPAEKISKNAAMKEPTLYLLRLLNLISEPRLGHSERRLYYYLRAKLFKFSSAVNNTIPSVRVVNPTEIETIRSKFFVSNKKLIEHGVSEDKLRQYGYID